MFGLMGEFIYGYDNVAHPPLELDNLGVLGGNLVQH
jgi:hypothetical protein